MECVYCGAPATINEHVIPRCQGGRLTQPSCRPCNTAKAGRTPTEWVIAMWSRFLETGDPHIYLRAILDYRSPLVDWAEVDRAKAAKITDMQRRAARAAQLVGVL